MVRYIKKIASFLLVLTFIIPNFVLAAPLSVSTLPIQNMTINQNTATATFLGIVTDENPEDVVVDLYGKFRYSTTSGTIDCEDMTGFTEINSVDPLTGLNFADDDFYNFSAPINQLQLNVEYFYCGIVSSTSDFSSDVLYGNVISFTPEIPGDNINDVETLGTSLVSYDSAVLNGRIIEDNVATQVWGRFRYSKNGSTDVGCASLPNAKNTAAEKRIGVGNFSMSKSIFDLEDGVTYYYCAVGADNPGFQNALYGAVLSFTTTLASGSNSSTIGPVDTLAANQIDDTEANLRGRYTAGAHGYAYFRVSTAPIPPIFCNQIYGSDMIGVTANKPDPIGYTTGGIFSAHINNLEPETDYYYCAVVSNRSYDPNKPRFLNPTQIKYGQVQKFRTLPCDTCNITTITTREADVLNSNSVTLKGYFKSSRAVSVFFEYTKLNDPQSLPNNTTTWQATPEKKYGVNSSSNYTYFLKGLENDTVYGYRAVGKVTNNDGSIEIFYGKTGQFKTNKYDGINGGNDTSGGGGYTPDIGVGNGGGGIIITDGDDNCPAGTTGTFPACVPIDDDNTPGCPPGWYGNPPKCFNSGPGSDSGSSGGGGIVKQPKVSISATPEIINPGESSIVTWTSAATTSCTVNGYDLGLSGSADTGPLENSASYTVSCVGPGGSAADTASVYVNITGGGNGGGGSGGGGGGGGDLVWVDVNSSPTFINSGGSATISWSSGGAQFCSTGGNGDGTSGSFSTGPLTSSTSYAVSCSGPSGSAGATAYVQVISTSGGNGGGGSGSGGGGSNNPGSGNPWSPGNSGGPGQNGNPPLIQDNDNDDDGTNNVHDDDTDGDWDPNDTDWDDDGDGIPDTVDATPNGPGTGSDFDGGGLENSLDNDIDGDGVPNQLDNDVDGDGAANSIDADDDGDGVPDLIDPTVKGVSGTNNLLVLGQEAIPPSDAIVRYREGIETVFARQVRNSQNFTDRYGYNGEDLNAFALNLAHTFAKYYFGYINADNTEVRVSAPDVSAYELRQVGNTLVVYEYYKNVIVDIRSRTTGFKQKNPYEYYFRRIFR